MIFKWLIAILGAGVLFADAAAAVPRPVVAELFTSQGCSSCPPAEAVLGELANKPDVIALAYHVEYWDYIGWRDRFGIPAAEQRQQQYAQALKLKSVFTPQLIVDGQSSLVGSNRQAVFNAIAAPRAGIQVEASVAGSNLEVTLPAGRAGAACEVTLIAYLPQTATAIGKGENAGRTVKEFNIVRALRKLGTWNGKPETFTVPLASLPADASRAAILLQESNQGAVAGATLVSFR